MLSRTLIALPLFSGLLSGYLGAQNTPEPSNAPIAALTTALYNDQANLKEPSDSARADVATAVLRTRLRDRLAEQVLPFERTDSAATAPDALQLTGGLPCNVKVACALAVARATGARWVVLTKVSKTSNLIWLLTAQLIRVSNGEIVLDDSTELKGEPDAMIRVGMRNFADRVVRTVRAGGVASNFPT